MVTEGEGESAFSLTGFARRQVSDLLSSEGFDVVGEVLLGLLLAVELLNPLVNGVYVFEVSTVDTSLNTGEAILDSLGVLVSSLPTDLLICGAVHIDETSPDGLAVMGDGVRDFADEIALPRVFGFAEATLVLLPKGQEGSLPHLRLLVLIQAEQIFGPVHRRDEVEAMLTDDLDGSLVAEAASIMDHEKPFGSEIGEKMLEVFGYSCVAIV